MLKEKGSNTLFLCGLSAVGCVLATKTGAQNNDYKAFIVKDAIMSQILITQKMLRQCLMPSVMMQ